MHTSPRQLDTIFPTSIVETGGCPKTARPGEHPQTAHNRDQGMVKTTPALRSRLEPNTPKKERIPSKYLETAPENQNSRAQAAHTIEQEATM